MSAMADMSRAIRTTLEPYGPTLKEIPEDVLREFDTIIAAFHLDIRDEVIRRESPTSVTAADAASREALS